MRALISKLGDKIYFSRKTRQLRRESVRVRRDLEFWTACNSPSGDPATVAMIEEKQAAARSKIHIG